jgi:hypothetical protein
MRMGHGDTVEAALTGEERHGGIQVTVFEPRPGRFPESPPAGEAGPSGPMRSRSPVMGLAAGGAMRQKIYPDPYGVDTWDPDARGAVVIHIADSQRYREITGEEPPSTPVDAATYTAHGLPWFDLYDEERGDIEPSERLARATTIATRDAERGSESAGDASVDIPGSQVRRIDPGPAATDRRPGG